MSMRVEKWNQRYQAAKPGSAAWVLREHMHLLPARGDALDLACGLGANALLLARAGLAVQAWDLSRVAIEQLRGLADSEQVNLIAKVRDVEAEPPAVESFDVIVVSHFLVRSLMPRLLAALRPGGLLFYQTFTCHRDVAHGPANPDFLLQPGELLQCCAELEILLYREERRVGNTAQGLRGLACLIGCRGLSGA